MTRGPQVEGEGRARLRHGVMFWLLRAYASCILKYIFDIFQNVKKLKQKIRTYIFTCYMPTKSLQDKLTCHVACMKKIKFGAKNKAFI
jgi:hypothetical protein